MKKVLFSATALALLCALAFADGPSISIWGRTVLNLLWCDSLGNEELGYKAGVIYSKWGPDSWTSFYGNDGMNMNININWDGPVMGYHMGFQFSNWDIFGDIASSAPVPRDTSGIPLWDQISLNDNALNIGFGAKVHTLYGSVIMIPNMLSLKIGLISDSTYKYDADVGSNWINNWQVGDLWAIPGAMLTFAPMDFLPGLKVSLNYRVPLAPIIRFIDDDFTYKDVNNGGEAIDQLKKIDFMASYSIFDIGTFTIGTTGVKGTGWWDIWKGSTNLLTNYPGRPIFAGVQLRMIENAVIKVAGSYVIPDDLTNYHTTFDLASITYKLDPFTFKLGGLFYCDLYRTPSPIVAYRVAGEVDLSLGDFYMTLWGNYSDEYALSYFEGGPTIKYNPIGIQIGFYYKQFVTSVFASANNYVWAVPIQIDFGF